MSFEEEKDLQNNEVQGESAQDKDSFTGYQIEPIEKGLDTESIEKK